MENEEVKYSEEIEKVINEKNTGCLLYGTDACRLLNPENCGECAVGEMSEEKQRAAKEALERLIAAADPDSLEQLYSGDKCLFCKDEPKGKGECYALFDLAKRDPEGDWTIALGKKKVGVKAADMILPMQVSCCKKCRKRHRLFDYLPTVAALVIAACGLLVTTNKTVYNSLYDVASWLPAAVMAGAVLVALVVAGVLRSALSKSLAKHMHAAVSEIPEIGALMDKGFYEVVDGKCGVSALVFSDSRREHGVCSHVSAEPEASETEE